MLGTIAAAIAVFVGTDIDDLVVLTVLFLAAVYVPLFRGIGPGASALTAATFAVMVAVWLGLAYRLGSHRRIVQAVDRTGHWLVPVVFIVIGVLVIARSIGIFARFG